MKKPKITLLYIFIAIIITNPSIVKAQESEHPPLPKNTKKAIATYKHNPTIANKDTLLKVMNENYDAIIQTKKDKLEERIRNRDKNINRWFQSVKSGGVPPFMELNTKNHKDNERQVIMKAIENYRIDSSSKNENAVKEALNTYYNLFLNEQVEHIKDTEDSREARMRTSLERFTSNRFQPNAEGAKNNIKQEEALAEIICNFIAIGAEIVPVNPESRVREREYNAAISTAQAEYLKDPTNEKRDKLRTELANAFTATYDVRIIEFSRAQIKGLNGGRALLSRITNIDFLQTQFTELTEQRNLYGRIDRMVTFGSNTVKGWQPRLQSDSRELSKLLTENIKIPSTKNRQAVEAKFNEIYSEMINLHLYHLQKVKNCLNTMIDETLSELID
ncbi:MAG: hypothetical protein ACRDDZ_12970 [Marinifilaceae bacterium]